MTNWKVFKITSKETFPMGLGFEGIRFYLDGDVTYKGERKFNYISFMVTNHNNCSINNYDYESYQIGDYLEINLSETVNYKASYGFNGDVVEIRNIVARKFGSSSNTNIITTSGSSSNIVISSGLVNAMGSSRTMELARHMSRMVDENDKEY